MAYGLTATWVLFTTGTIGGTIRTPWGIARLFDLSFLLTPGVWAVFSAIYFLCVFAFMRRIREALVGVLLSVSIALMATLRISETARLDTMPSLTTMLVGVLITTWTLALVATPGSMARKEQVGHEMMCGVFGAIMCLTAWSKWSTSGLQWLDGNTHALWIYERAAGPVVVFEIPMLRAFRMWLSDHPTICSFGAGYTLLVESLGFLFVVPRWRKAYAIAVAGMLIGLGVGLGFAEPGWIELPLALGFSQLASAKDTTHRAPTDPDHTAPSVR
ncbi:MAG: hypothetical protein CL927_12955 [Deltaproteobacteria bacterium]|nr:hypothetical protein [Deltaproteobacteria bacterium]HCH65263.1 hypothetical protein [Deltaproteobacteria bacterium]